MKRGDWTKTMALVLESAIEAILLEAKRVQKEVDCLDLLRQFRGLTFDYGVDRGTFGHEINWSVFFEPLGETFFSSQIIVRLRCDKRCRHEPCTWSLRLVNIGQPVETWPVLVYIGELDKSLEAKNVHTLSREWEDNKDGLADLLQEAKQEAST